MNRPTTTRFSSQRVQRRMREHQHRATRRWQDNSQRSHRYTLRCKSNRCPKFLRT
ncbi:MAG: hypothetical protein ACOCVP_08130 [Wenzhouxiangella sp.]